jgi:hypothetical protein
VKRGFWVAFGLGAGATGAILFSRWTKKQARRVAPQTLSREAKGGLMDLSKLVAESIQEGKRAAEEREAELRRDLGYDEPGHDDEAGPTAASPLSRP